MLGYLDWISFLGYDFQSYPNSQKISLDILTYPYTSYHILSYPKISSGANSQMTMTDDPQNIVCTLTDDPQNKVCTLTDDPPSDCTFCHEHSHVHTVHSRAQTVPIGADVYLQHR